MKQIKVKLKDNTIVTGDEFDIEDYKEFKRIFRKWTNINLDLKRFGGRNLNVPDVFSEALYCIFFNAVRTNGTAHSQFSYNLCPARFLRSRHEKYQKKPH